MDTREKELAEKLVNAREKVRSLAMVNTVGLTMEEKRTLAVKYELAHSVMVIAQHDLTEHIKSGQPRQDRKEFKCPECGGFRWGTTNCNQDFSEWVGHCNDCHNFKWPRTEDHKYFS